MKLSYSVRTSSKLRDRFSVLFVTGLSYEFRTVCAHNLLSHLTNHSHKLILVALRLLASLVCTLIDKYSLQYLE